MKLFLDTADINIIQKYIPTGLIDGVTTNPSLLAQNGTNPKQNILDILSLFKEGIISVEITEDDPQKAYLQAKKIAAISPHILVKIPCHKNYYPIIHQLKKENIPLNITLVFSAIQGLLMAKLGVDYISPFIGRWDDIDIDGTQVIRELRMIIDTYGFKTKILAASIRHVRHVHESLLAGADAITIPGALFEKIMAHPLTDHGIQQFNTDWAKTNTTQFP